jgi:hypothetical protein
MKRNGFNFIKDRMNRSSDTQLVCPHCQSNGTAISKTGKVKKDISGGKATAAVLTVGFLVFAAGLSRKESVTQRTCSNCKTTWEV